MTCDNQQIVLNDKDNRSSVFTVRDAESAMMTFTIFAIAVIVGIFLYEIVLKRNNIVSFLYTVVVNVSSVLSAATLLTILLEGFDIMFFRRTREELAKLREEKAQFKEEKEQFKEEKEQFEKEKKSVTNSAEPKDVEPDE